MSYVKQIPRDKNEVPLQEFPAPFPALARYTRENGAASSVITLTEDTTVIEVASSGAVASDVVIRWVPTTDTEASVVSAASGANWDHFIGKSTVRRFAVPKEVTNVPANSVVGVNVREGLYRRVAVKTTATASLFLAEF